MDKEDFGVIAGLKTRSKAHSWGIALTSFLLLGVVISNVMMYNYIFQRIDRESQEVNSLKIALGKGDFSSSEVSKLKISRKTYEFDK